MFSQEKGIEDLGGRRRRVSEGVGAGGRRDGHGCWRIGVVFALLALGGRRSFAVKKSRCGVKLNSKRWETDRQFHILRGASCRDVASSLVVAVCLMSINGKMKRRSGFGTIIAKTRGACVITVN